MMPSNFNSYCIYINIYIYGIVLTIHELHCTTNVQIDLLIFCSENLFIFSGLLKQTSDQCWRTKCSDKTQFPKTLSCRSNNNVTFPGFCLRLAAVSLFLSLNGLSADSFPLWTDNIFPTLVRVIDSLWGFYLLLSVLFAAATSLTFMQCFMLFANVLMLPRLDSRATAASH